jgi:hypothetical protein
MDSIANIVGVISVNIIDYEVTVLIKLRLIELKPMVVVSHVSKHLSGLQKGEFVFCFTVWPGK